MEYINKHGKDSLHLLTALPPGCQCIKQLYGKELPKDYLFYDVNSKQLIKHNTQIYKKLFPYIVISGDKVNIIPKNSIRYDVDKIINRLNRI